MDIVVDSGTGPTGQPVRKEKTVWEQRLDGWTHADLEWVRDSVRQLRMGRELGEKGSDEVVAGLLFQVNQIPETHCNDADFCGG